MLSNEIFALACRAYYDEQGVVVDASNGEFAHSPLPERYGNKGYYLLHGHHQHQGLLQSKDIGECCFFAADAKKWLLKCDYFPDGYFEMWEIYEKYASEHSRKNAEKLNAEKDEFGRSVIAVKGATAAHAVKDELGRSLTALKAGIAAHIEKDEFGRSVLGVKNGKRLHSVKDESGKSINARKGMQKTHAAIHAKKDGLGRSVTVMKTNNQVWESIIDGFRSHASGVARHNRARGWDPAARIRIS